MLTRQQINDKQLISFEESESIATWRGLRLSHLQSMIFPRWESKDHTLHRLELQHRTFRIHFRKNEGFLEQIFW